MKKCIFLSVSGQTPQIITETLFKLREEGREIVDIYVVTTSTGKNNILKCLLGIDPNDGSTVGKNIFIEMSREYGWNEITLNKDKIRVFTDNTDRQLEDIRTDEDERIAADSKADCSRAGPIYCRAGRCQKSSGGRTAQPLPPQPG